MRRRSRRQQTMKTIGACSVIPSGVWTVALLLAFAASPLTPGVGAEEEGGPIAFGDSGLLEPIERSLGASSWMAASGYDPRLWDIPDGGAGRTEVDWGSYGVGINASPRGGTAFAPQVPFRSAAPAFSRNQIVTRQLGLFPLQTEPHITVNPNDPEHLVMGTIDYNFPSMSTYTSFDGGETWDGPNQIRYFAEDLAAAGDPVAIFDRDGSVYMTFISLGIEEYRLGSLVSATEISSIAVAKSTDDGLSWEEPVSTARSRIETTSLPDPDGRDRGEVAVDFLDKPWIAVGPHPDDPARDVIYVAYTEFKTRYSALYADEVPFLTSPVTETTIRLVRSEDGGVSWSEPVAVSPTVFQFEGAGEEGEGEAGEAGGQQTQDDDGEGGGSTQEEGEAGANETDQTVQGPQPAVLSDGTVVVAYLDTTLDGVQEGLATIMVASSRDGGQTFDEPSRANVMREIKFRPRNSSFRWWGAAFPQIAVGPNDEIYILTTGQPPDKPTDDGDIYLLRSLDLGRSWQVPIRLNQDDTDRIQFFPSIDVAPDGTVHAMWGDMRDDPDEVRYHIYYSRSQNQGETWGFENAELGLNTPDTRVTDFPSNSLKGFPGGRFLGDYFSLAASEEDVYLVWADTRLGEFGGPNQQIGFARQQAIAPPSLFLNPPSGDAGRDVAIQGFGFQPDSNITIDVGGITVTNLRANEKGEFQTNIYMPVTGEGPRNVTAYDETGNVATASFYTEFGFDSIARELDELAAADGRTGGPDATPAAATPVANEMP
ncbi:MAG TPA: sialidase family protein [Thermomicrobiales bacterium]|nr:sialidase family protein [Thermomicrobiales bacterium]